MRVVTLLWIGLLLAACQAQESPASWQPVTTFGSSHHIEPPAIITHGEQPLFVWSGADATEARLFAATPQQAATILALPTRLSYQHRVYPALNENAHILWMDTMLDAGPRLRAGTLAPNLIAQTGPLTLSREDTYHYAATPLLDGGIQIVWTSGFAGEPALHTSIIDGLGRPGFAEHVADNVQYPALITDGEGNVWLYWLWNGDLLRGRLVGSIIENPVIVGPHVSLERGDYIDAFYAVMDETHAYVIWQISRASGQWEVWWANGDKANDTWTPPQRLTFTYDDERTVQTGFNSGVVYGASNTDTSRSLVLVPLARPLQGQHRSVPLAIYAEGSVGIVYLQAGRVMGYQPLVEAAVLRAPAIAVDRDLYLTLGWGEIGEGQSTLNYMTTHPQ